MAKPFVRNFGTVFVALSLLIAACGDTDTNTQISLGVTLDGDTLQGPAPLTIVLTATVTGSWTPSSFTWSFGDGEPETTSDTTVAHEFRLPGTYAVTVTASQDNGFTITSEPVTVTVGEPLPLVVRPTAQPDSGVAPLTVGFEPGIEGGIPPFQHVWDFGDGDRSDAASPEHTYEEAGTYDVALTITDTVGTQADGRVEVSVEAPENLAPEPVADSAQTDEDAEVVIDVVANDTDPEGDELTLDDVSDPPSGTAIVTNNGRVRYTPDPDFNGEETFTYSVSDAAGNSVSGEVTVTVLPVNDPPVVEADSASVDEDGEIVIAVLDNDGDVDGDTLQVVAIKEPEQGSATIVEAGTAVSYSPDPDYNGSDSFEYTVDDGSGTTVVGAITITVVSVNDLPVPQNDAATTAEDTPLFVDVLANDTDIETVDLVVVAVSGPSNGAVVIDEGGSGVTYAPNANFFGEDTFNYTIRDADDGEASADVTVTVTPVNDTPVAVDDVVALDEDGSLTIDVLANDSDIETLELEVVSVSTPASGAASISEGIAVTYTPSADFNGDDGLTYTISDGELSATATIDITVNPVNDPPLITNTESLRVNPLSPLITDDLALPEQPTTFDVDGDTVTLGYAWQARLAGTEDPFADMATGSGVTVIPDLLSDSLQNDFTYRLSITPNDGFVDGDTFVTATVTIGNSAPELTIESLTLVPSPAFSDQALALAEQPTATDADEDTVFFNVRWQIQTGEDTWADLPEAAETEVATVADLAVDYTSRDNTYRVIVAPTDLLTEGLPLASSPADVINSTPQITNDPQIAQSAPLTLVELTLDAAHATFDADPADEVALSYQWEESADGPDTGFAPIDGAQADSLPAILTQKNYYYRLVTTPSDGTLEGTPHTTLAVLVGNSMPVLTNAPTITPPTPTTVQPLVLSATATGQDDDPADSVSFLYQWRSSTVGPDSGFSDITDANDDNLPAGLTARDIWYVVLITPSDLQDQGVTYASPAVRVINTPPTIVTMATIQQAAPPTTVDLTINEGDIITQDVDDDDVTLTHQWQESPPGGSFTDMVDDNATTLLSSLTVEDYRYRICSTASDDETGETECSNVVVIGNTPPTIETMAQIQQASPLTGDDLTIDPSDIVTEDLDGDPVTLTHQWFESTDLGDNYAAIVDETSATLASGFTTEANYYRICSTANDEGTGETECSAPVVIGNTPPTIVTMVDIDQSSPVTGDDLTIDSASIVTDDPDPDTLSLTLQWQESTNGGASFGDIVGEDAELLPSGFTSEDNHYRVCATVHDEAPGETECSAAVVIGNTPPQIDDISGLTYAQSPVPTSQDIDAIIDAVTYSDVDGDDVSLEPQWQESTDGAIWTVIADETDLSLPSLATVKNAQYRLCLTPRDTDGDAGTQVCALTSVLVINTAPAFTGTTPAENPDICPAQTEGVAGITVAEDLTPGQIVTWLTQDDDADALDLYLLRGQSCANATSSGPDPYDQLSGLVSSPTATAIWNSPGRGEPPTGQPDFSCDPCDGNGVHDPNECNMRLYLLDTSDGTASDAFRFTPFADRFGQAGEFLFAVADDEIYGVSANVGFYVQGSPDDPVAAADNLADEFGFDEDTGTPFVIPAARLFDNDDDADIGPDPCNPSDALALGALTAGTGAAGVVIGDDGGGNQTVVFTPVTNFNSDDAGQPASFTYSLVDIFGGTSATVTVQFNVDAVNDPPTVVTPLPPVLPATPFTIHDLSVTGIVFDDVENDTVTATYQWRSSADDATYVDHLVTAGASLDADDTVKDTWYRLCITPSDADAGPTECTSGVFVSNSPPTVPTVDLTPDSPNVNDLLTCGFETESTDPDLDGFHYEYEWYVGATLQTLPSDQSTLDATDADYGEGETVTCRARGVDEPAAAAGQWDGDTVTIGNAPPVLTDVSAVTFSPDPALTLQDITADVADIVGDDPDGDPLTVLFQWESSSDGTTWGTIAGADQNPLDALLTTKGLLYRVCLTLEDDDAATSATLCTPTSVAVINTPAVITGTTPAPNTDICPGVTPGVAGVEVDEEDTDGEDITVTVQEDDGDAVTVYWIEPNRCSPAIAITPPHPRFTGLNYADALLAEWSVDVNGNPTGQPDFDCFCDPAPPHEAGECDWILVPLTDPDGMGPDTFNFNPWHEEPDWQEFGQNDPPIVVSAFDGDVYSDIGLIDLYVTPNPDDPPVAQDDDLEDDFGFDEDTDTPYLIPVSELISGGSSSERDYDPDIPDSFPRFWSDPCDTGGQSFDLVYALETTGAAAGGVSLVEIGGVDYVSFLPATNFNGTAGFEYELEDEDGNGSNTAVAIFTVNAVNDAPTVVTLPNISPSSPLTGNDLTVTGIVIDDVEGDPFTVTYQWQRRDDDSIFADYLETADAALDSDDTDKDFYYQLCVTATDSEAGPTACTNEVFVDNSAPSTPTVSLTPDPADVTDTLTCVGTGSTDPDSVDTVDYEYTWYVNNVLQTTQSGGAQSTLANGTAGCPSCFSRGNVVDCDVRAFDDHGTPAFSATASDSVTIGNADPNDPTVALTPNNPMTTSQLQCSSASSDPDGDPVTYEYRWLVGGMLIAGEDQATFGGTLNRNDEIECESRVTDDPQGGASNWVGSGIVTVLPSALPGTLSSAVVGGGGWSSVAPSSTEAGVEEAFRSSTHDAQLSNAQSIVTVQTRDSADGQVLLFSDDWLDADGNIDVLAGCPAELVGNPPEALPYSGGLDQCTPGTAYDQLNHLAPPGYAGERIVPLDQFIERVADEVTAGLVLVFDFGDIDFRVIRELAIAYGIEDSVLYWHQNLALLQQVEAYQMGELVTVWETTVKDWQDTGASSPPEDAAWVIDGVAVLWDANADVSGAVSDIRSRGFGALIYDAQSQPDLYSALTATPVDGVVTRNHAILTSLERQDPAIVPAEDLVTGDVGGLAGWAIGLHVAAGDFNNDGVHDFVHCGDNGDADNPVRYLAALYGPSVNAPDDVTRLYTDTADITYVNLCRSLLVADMNNDGYDDVMMGLDATEPGVTGGPVPTYGAVAFYLGSESGLTFLTDDPVWIPGTTIFSLFGLTAPGSPGTFNFGYALAAADVDVDGDLDFIASSPDGRFGQGTIEHGYVVVLRNATVEGGAGLFDPSSGYLFTPATGVQILDGEPIQGDLGCQGFSADANFGFAVAAGDMDGDGDAEIAIGQPGRSVGRDLNVGQVFLVVDEGLENPADDGFWALLPYCAAFDQEDLGFAGENEPNDFFGVSLAMGDFTFDGAADLAIGAPYESYEETGVSLGGRVYFLQGQLGQSPLSDEGTLSLATDNAWLSPNWAGWPGGDVPTALGTKPVTFDLFGFSLVVADLNEDNYADLFIGSPYDKLINSDSPTVGSVLALMGNRGGPFALADVDGGPADIRLFVLGHEGLPGTDDTPAFLGFDAAVGDFDDDGMNSLFITMPGWPCSFGPGCGGALDVDFALPSTSVIGR